MKKIKPKLCAICKEPFIPKQITPVCSYKCAIIFNSEKEVKKRVKQMKVEVQKLSDLEHIARVWFQKWVRLRDQNEPCISCPRTETPQWDGGHFLKAELYTGLIFEPINCNKQCCYCNAPPMSGNYSEYRKGMIRKYGEQMVNELEERADKARVYKFSRQELIEIATEYKLKYKELLK